MNVSIIAINVEESITDQDILDKLNLYQNPFGKSKVKIIFAEVRATREEILKRFSLDLIKSDLWFHILKFVSQRNLQHQRTLVHF